MHRFGHRALAGVAALLAGCDGEYIGEIPPVARMRLTAQRTSLRVGDSTAIITVAP